MRLAEYDKKAICRILHEQFGANAKLWLFGSRVDDSLQGGDIDLMVEPGRLVENSLAEKIQAVAAIQMAIGDQKIDLLIRKKTIKESRIYKVAEATGVRL